MRERPGGQGQGAAGPRTVAGPAPAVHGDSVFQVLERGDVQFFFRPMVQPADATAYTLGVQSFFLVLSPAGGPHRRLRIGKKRMPAARRERFWARVERVGTLQRVLGPALEAEVYATKTRGERYQPAARPIAHGSYELVRHTDPAKPDAPHVHLRWEAEPFGFEDAPDEIGLADSGDHLVLFENTGPGKAVWTERGDITTLDEEGTEIVICGPTGDRVVRVEDADAEAGGDGDGRDVCSVSMHEHRDGTGRL